MNMEILLSRAQWTAWNGLVTNSSASWAKILAWWWSNILIFMTSYSHNYHDLNIYILSMTPNSMGWMIWPPNWQHLSFKFAIIHKIQKYFKMFTVYQLLNFTSPAVHRLDQDRVCKFWENLIHEELKLWKMKEIITHDEIQSFKSNQDYWCQQTCTRLRFQGDVKRKLDSDVEENKLIKKN